MFPFVATSMTHALTAVARMAGHSPRSPFIRRAVGASLFILGVICVGLFALSPAQRGVHDVDILVAGVANLLLAGALLGGGAISSPRLAQMAAGSALAIGSAAAVFATGGAHGVLNLVVPIIVLAAVVLLPFRQAAATTGIVAVSHVAGTLLHGPLGGHAGYELAEALIIAAVALAGVHILRRNLLHQATTLKDSNDELQARVRELAALHELALGAGTAIGEEELAGRGLKVAVELSGGDAGVLWMRACDGLLRAAATQGWPEQARAWDTLRKLEELGPLSTAAREQRTLLTTDADEAARALFGAADHGHADLTAIALHGSLVAVTPLVATGTLVGIVVVLHRTGDKPDENTLNVMETLGIELALVLDRKRKSMLVEHQRRQLEALSQIASRVTASLDVQEVLDFAVSQTATLMDADTAFIATTLEGSEDDLQIVSHHGFRTNAMARLVIEKGRGIGGRVAKDERVHQSVDYGRDDRLEDGHKRAVAEEGLVTMIGAPLVNRRRVVGVLYAARRHRQVFTAEEAHLLSILGVQVAVAVENARLFEDVTEQSIRDPLTGAYNRRFFDQRLEEETARSRRGGNPTSLLMLDVDDFKHYNDTHGHPKGDILLKELVALCASSVRSSDIVGRYGGEEFVVLFPDTDLSAALPVATRIHETVRRVLGERLGASDRVSVSGGVAELDPLAPDPVGLLQRADDALYEAKAAGKDRIHANRTAYVGPVPKASGGADPLRAARRSAGAE